MGTADNKFEVLIVGAGPAGLALAIELGSRGVRCLIVERHDRVGHAPRAKTTHTRTREHLRRWGIADKLAAAAPFGIDYPSTILFVTQLAGYQLARFDNAFNCAPGKNDLYSEHAQWVPQYRLEEVMRAHIETLPTVELRFNVSVQAIEQSDSSVTCRALDTASGKTLAIECDYLVGADGARSLVRETIGGKMEGEAGLSRSFNIIFRAPGLAEAHPHGPAIMYWQVNADLPSAMGPMDKDDLWFFMPANIPADLELTDESAGSLIRKASGVDMAFEILSSDEWYPNRLIADKYSERRIFIVGDACHVHPPQGGYGMNMGVADSVDLGWKLAAVLEGWANPSLLDSYELERRPVHHRVIEEAMSNQAANLAILKPGLDADDAAGEALREEIGQMIIDTRVQEFRSLGVVLGYSYSGSPFVAAEVGQPPHTPSAQYEPTAYPGHLAPHAWLDDGGSLYDLFGAGFTLLVTSEGHEDAAEATASSAVRLGVPLKVVRKFSPKLRALYGAPLALIRPDQHVTWRGDDWPGDEVLERATGRTKNVQTLQNSHSIDARSA